MNQGNRGFTYSSLSAITVSSIYKLKQLPPLRFGLSSFVHLENQEQPHALPLVFGLSSFVQIENNEQPHPLILRFGLISDCLDWHNYLILNLKYNFPSTYILLSDEPQVEVTSWDTLLQNCGR